MEQFRKEYGTDELRKSLKDTFGYPCFRENQLEVVQAVLRGKDVLAVLPTGGGKSVCYQLPALLLPGITLVVTPLIALMKDQVDRLRRCGIEQVADFHSGLPSGELRKRLHKLARGEYKLVYSAPERFNNFGFRETLRRQQISTFVVDEAHCLSQWGHDFRPEYLELQRWTEEFNVGSILAVTATATPVVRREIVESLRLTDPTRIVASFDRPNLSFSAVRSGKMDKEQAVLRILRQRPGSAIIYVGRQRDAELVSLFLRDCGEEALPYHAGMQPGNRVENQDRFIAGDVRVIAATVAFGMGIDKPDIRTVIHHQHPGSLEAYYQEAGRAGRDGKPAHCAMLYNRNDGALHEYFIRISHPSREEVYTIWRRLTHDVEFNRLTYGMHSMSDTKFKVILRILEEEKLIRQVSDGKIEVLYRRKTPPEIRMDSVERKTQADCYRLDRIRAFLEAKNCRRGIILRYFGEIHPPEYACGNCDNCSVGKQKSNAAVRPKIKALPIASVPVPPVPPVPSEGPCVPEPVLLSEECEASGPAMSPIQEPGSEPIPESTILDALRSLHAFRLGRTGFAQFLAGSGSKKLERLGLPGEPHFGCLSRLTQRQILDQIDQMIETDRIRVKKGRLPLLCTEV